MRAEIFRIHVVIKVMVRPGLCDVSTVHGQAVDVDGFAGLEQKEDRKETRARLRNKMGQIQDGEWKPFGSRLSAG